MELGPMEDYNLMRDQARKMLVGLAIEKTLLEISKSCLDKFEGMLYERHRCAVLDCYEHPEYLSEIVKELFGNSYMEVIKSVEKYLNEFSYQYPIEQFLRRINR